MGDISPTHIDLLYINVTPLLFTTLLVIMLLSPDNMRRTLSVSVG
jgi:hypothetical protein